MGEDDIRVPLPSGLPNAYRCSQLLGLDRAPQLARPRETPRFDRGLREHRKYEQRLPTVAHPGNQWDCLLEPFLGLGEPATLQQPLPQAQKRGRPGPDESGPFRQRDALFIELARTLMLSRLPVEVRQDAQRDAFALLEPAFSVQARALLAQRPSLRGLPAMLCPDHQTLEQNLSATQVYDPAVARPGSTHTRAFRPRDRRP